MREESREGVKEMRVEIYEDGRLVGVVDIAGIERALNGMSVGEALHRLIKIERMLGRSVIIV